MKPIINSITFIFQIAYHILLIILLHFPNVSHFLHDPFMNFTLFSRTEQTLDTFFSYTDTRKQEETYLL